MGTRTALYARQSANLPKGIDRQTADGIELCRRKGWPEPAPEDHFLDNHLSASRFARKPRAAYLRLLKAIEAGEYDRVVMVIEDRTHRQVLELAEFVNLCRERNVRVATVGTEYDLDDTDQMTMWFIKVRFAEAETEKLSRRVRRARRQEAENGERHPGGKRAFGTEGRRRVQDDGGDWRTVPAVSAEQAAAERALIRQAARRILAGDSLRGIVLDYNTGGHTGADGTRWTTRTLKRMLTSPRLAGLRDHLGTVHPSASIAPVLDRETWEAVKAVLTDPARATAGSGGPGGPQTAGGVARHLLTGLAFCGVCGSRLRCDKRDGVTYYRCGARSDGGRRCVQRHAELVEQLITGALFDAVESPEWDRLADRPTGDPTRELYEMLARDQARLDKLDDEQVMATLDNDGVKAASISRVRADIEARMERTRNRADRMRGGRVVAAVPRNLRQVWNPAPGKPGLSMDRKRAILAAVIERVVIGPQGKSPVFDPSTIEVTWRA